MSNVVTIRKTSITDAHRELLDKMGKCVSDLNAETGQAFIMISVDDLVMNGEDGVFLRVHNIIDLDTGEYESNDYIANLLRRIADSLGGK